MKSIVFPFTKCSIHKIRFCYLITMGANDIAQLSGLRQSRKPLPGVSDISRVGITVELGHARYLIDSNFIGETLQSQLESLGYRVSLTSTTASDGLWVNVDCEGIEEKMILVPRNNVNRSSVNVSTMSPPCQLTYLYQQE